MVKARDPLDIAKEAIEKALTSNKPYTSSAKPLSQADIEKETKLKEQENAHKKTPH